MKMISESEMNFGKFDEENLFHIESSKLYQKIGENIKTVEFILKYNEKSILFLEAKKSCPNAENRYDSQEKEKKFEEYYVSIVEKFVASLQIYLACFAGKYEDLEEIGMHLRDIKNLKDIQLKFVLVIKNAENITWLAGPMAELKSRLISFRKIWNIEIVVLNEELAKQYKLAC